MKSDVIICVITCIVKAAPKYLVHFTHVYTCIHTCVHMHTASTKPSHLPPQDWPQNLGARYLGKMLSIRCVSFWGLQHKAPRPGGLKTTEVCSLTVLDARSLKSRCGQGWFLLEAFLVHKDKQSYSFTAGGSKRVSHGCLHFGRNSRTGRGVGKLNSGGGGVGPGNEGSDCTEKLLQRENREARIFMNIFC